MFDSTTIADPQGWLLPSADVLEKWWVASQRAAESAAAEWPCPASGEGDSGLPEHTAMPVDWFGVTDRADPQLTHAQLAADWAAAQALLAGPGGAAGSLLASVEVADLSGCGRLDFLVASERRHRPPP